MANASEPFSAPTTEKDIEILNLLELEDQARKVISKGPFGYISGGSGDELTLRENIAGFDDHMIVPRYLTGIDEPDMPAFIRHQRQMFMHGQRVRGSGGQHDAP